MHYFTYHTKLLRDAEVNVLLYKSSILFYFLNKKICRFAKIQELSALNILILKCFPKFQLYRLILCRENFEKVILLLRHPVKTVFNYKLIKKLSTVAVLNKTKQSYNYYILLHINKINYSYINNMQN